MEKHSVNPNIFKAYDIRGIYPEDINENAFYEMGKAFAEFLKRKYQKQDYGKLKIIIGKDARKSSVGLSQSFTSGVLERGVDVIDIGFCSTPLFYFSVNIERADGGAMITASHIPPPYNGLKLTQKKAFPIGRETGLRELRDFIEKKEPEKPSRKGKMVGKNFLDDYVDFVTKDVKIKDFKIVADTGNGMAGLLLPKTFKKLQVSYIPLYFELDGTFPNHEANPLKEETLKDLISKVKEEKADLGVAFDGDGDRIRFVTREGEPIRNDLVTALLAKDILKSYPGSKILYNSISSKIVKETIEENKGIPIRSRVGHAFIKQVMDEEGVIFGGEVAGHFFFRETFNRESSILAMVKILVLMSKENKELSELIGPFKKYFISSEINFTVKDMDKKTKEIEKKYQDGKIDHLDGLTVEYPDWWFNLRPSGSEPLLRLNLEANTKKLFDEKLNELKSAIQTG